MSKLYASLKASYGDKKGLKNLEKRGFVKDNELSNDNQQTYYNSKKKKLLYTVSGTHNLNDWGTNAYLAMGKLKDTNRYKEADRNLKLAKLKYNPTRTVLTGHSLGGGIINGIGSSSDKIKTLDAGYTFGQKARSNVKNYRTSGDIVSSLSPPKNTITLSNPNKNTYIYPIDALNAHNVNNIKNFKR